jgi:hypothetical protein
VARNDPEVLEVRGVLRHALTLLVPHDSAADAHQLAAAEADLDRATTARPDLVKGLNRLSAIHEQRGDYSRAAVEAEQAWHADAYFDEVDEILNRLFNVNFHQQNDAAASAWCNRIGERFPDSREYARCRLLLMAWTDEPPDTAAAWRLAEIGARASAESIRPTQTAQLHLLVAGVLARSDRQAALLLVRRTRDRFRPDSIFDKPPGVPQLLLEEAAVYALLARAAPGQTEWTSSACDRLDQAARFSGGPVLSRQRQFRDLLESCHIPATMTPRQ